MTNKKFHKTATIPTEEEARFQSRLWKIAFLYEFVFLKERLHERSCHQNLRRPAHVSALDTLGKVAQIGFVLSCHVVIYVQAMTT
jgi:hypothetical protein